jgi:DNA-binding IclR family transcriptional regulator
MPAQPNQSLIHGITCLQAVVAAERPIGSREVARMLGEEHTRVSRLLSTLASIGLLEQTAQRKYLPGPGLHVLAAQSLRGSKLLACALPHLTPLLGQGMTVALGVLWERQVCFLFHSKPGQPLEQSIGQHQLHPAERSSVGLALLAHALPPTEVRPGGRVVDVEPVDPVQDLEVVLAGVQKRGYARLRFAEKGILSVSVPLGEPPFAAIALSGAFVEAETERVVGILRETRDAILRDLQAAHGAGAQ